jgi:hypothetical protein
MIRRLYDGAHSTGLTVRPDPDWPAMWRVHYPNGTVSDMVNISRATDAGAVWLRNNTSHHRTSFARWVCALAPRRAVRAKNQTADTEVATA